MDSSVSVGMTRANRLAVLSIVAVTATAKQRQSELQAAAGRGLEVGLRILDLKKVEEPASRLNKTLRW